MKYLIFIIVFMFSVVCNAQTYIKGKALIAVPATTATAAGTTTLTTASQTNQQFTGSTTQTVVLPDATTLPSGRSFFITNRSSGVVTLNYNGGSLAQSLAAGTEVRAYLISNGSAAGTWDISYISSGGGGGVTSIKAGTGLSPLTITSTGTLNVDVGTAANKIVQLTAGAQMPAVDGNLLTNLNPANVQNSAWVAYTPTFVGFGTVTSINIQSRRNGPNLEILGSFVVGTPTAVTASFTIGFNGTNSNVTGQSWPTAYTLIGKWATDLNNATLGSGTSLIITTSATVINFGYEDSTHNSLTPQLGNSIVTAGNRVSVQMSMPINGW